jgi:hypothetical protein
MPTTKDVVRMRRIVARMRKAGLTVVEVDGWGTRGRPQTFEPRGLLEHYDASTKKSGNWGSLGVITRGRPEDGIPGPLAQFQVSRRGEWAVVAAGRCNHAGIGGPWNGIPQDSGNRYLYGVEVAANGRDPYGEALHRSLDIGLAAILAELP